MDILQQLGTALGLGLLSGLRLYLTILGLGTALRLHWITLDPSQSGLAVLEDWRVMTFAGVACLVEFVADKIPWVDSMWDSVHTFIRPIGAVVLGALAFLHADPAVQIILSLLCGGLALSGHSAKAAARLAVNHSPEPFSNIALSLAGDAAVPIGTWIAFHYPLLTFGAVVIFLLLFGWLAPRAWRTIRLEVTALSAALGRWFGATDEGDAAAWGSGSPLPREFYDVLRPVPEAIGHELKMGEGARAAATQSIPGLYQSLGYLGVTNDRLIFVTRRNFRAKQWSLALTEIKDATWTAGILIDKLYVTADGGQFRFDILKPLARRQSLATVAPSAAK